MAGSRMESSRIAFIRDLIVCVCTVISGLPLPVSLAASDPGDAKPVKFQQLEELESSECVRLKSMSVWCETAGTGEAGPMASFPNLMEQSNEDQAYESLKKYQPILELDPHDGPTSPPSCPLYLRKYICPMFAPECIPGVDVPQLPPCRHVCHAAAGACSDSMRRVLSMGWPSEWTCGALPVDGLCLNISLSTSRVTPKPEVRSHAMLWPSSGGSLMPPPSSTADRARELDREMFRSEGRSQEISSSIFADGDRRFFRGWVDVQGRGSANDYCRVIGTNIYNRFLSCALDGAINAHAHTYVSKRGFSIGQWKTWYMRDMDGDGRDDYCRCIIIGLNVSEVCMKAGPRGFYGSRLQSGSEFSFNVLKPASNSLCRTLNQHPVRSNQRPVRSNQHPARSNPHPVQLNQHPVRPNQHPVQNNQHLQRLRH